MSGTPRCCNTLRSTPLGNLDPVIRLFEGIFLTASANLIRNRGFHVDYLGHAHLILLREVAGRLQSKVKQTTQAINRLHNLLARVFPELATLTEDIRACTTIIVTH